MTKRASVRYSSEFYDFTANLRNKLSLESAIAAYRVRDSLGENLNQRLDYGKLQNRVHEKPRTKAGQVRQAWPEIKKLIAAGHSLKDICKWLNEIGLEIGYARLSHYLGQMREREAEPQGLPNARRHDEHPTQS